MCLEHEYHFDVMNEYKKHYGEIIFEYCWSISLNFRIVLTLNKLIPEKIGLLNLAYNHMDSLTLLSPSLQPVAYGVAKSCGAGLTSDTLSGSVAL